MCECVRTLMMPRAASLALRAAGSCFLPAPESPFACMQHSRMRAAPNGPVLHTLHGNATETRKEKTTPFSVNYMKKPSTTAGCPSQCSRLCVQCDNDPWFMTNSFSSIGDIQSTALELAVIGHNVKKHTSCGAPSAAGVATARSTGAAE